MYLEKPHNIVSDLAEIRFAVRNKKWSFQPYIHKMRFCQVFCKERCL